LLQERKRRRGEEKRVTETQINPPYAAVSSSPRGMEIRPPGLTVQLELAGIEVRFLEV